MAVLSRRGGLIFLHVPKTGGTSIAAALAAFADIAVPDERMHLTLDECADYLTDREIRTWRKVMVVRNTWDRMVSAYWHHLRDPLLDIAAYRDVRDGGFEGFLRGHARATWCAQTRWLRYRGAPAEIEVLRYETLSADFAAFAREVGIAAGLPRLNRTEDRPRAEAMYTAHTCELVGAVFGDEIEAFGFVPPAVVATGPAEAAAQALRRKLVERSDRIVAQFLSRAAP